MERCQAYAAVGLAAAALLFLGCGDATSPVQPTPSSVAGTPQALSEFSLSGAVTDTASRHLGGASVEIIAGPRAGTMTTTDEAGRFSMPGTFTGVITVRASKDGYVSQTRTVPPDRPLPPPSGQPSRWEVAFSLESLAPPVDIAGEYTLTLTADHTCANLPDETRTRTYAATIVPDRRSTTFLARLSDGRFFSSYRTFYIRTAADFARLDVWGEPDPDPADDPGPGIVEQLLETTYLAVGGEAAASIGPSGLTAPFSGYFEYCPSESALTAAFYRCTSSARVSCDSRHHQLTLVRR